MLDHRLTDYGIETTFVDTSNLESVEAAINEKTKVLYYESIANPSMKVPDFNALVNIAHKNNVVVVCDNTFASPYVVRPLDWGLILLLKALPNLLEGTMML